MELAERYLELALRFRRLAPFLAESYTGPPELESRVAAEPLVGAPQLADQATGLRSAVAAAEPDAARAAWLDGQLRGLNAACRRLAGEPLGYRELVERCYGVRAVEVDESQFAGAHELLGGVLPGRGELLERYAVWKRSQLVVGEKLIAGLRALATELGRRAVERWALPAGERVEFEVVGERPWAANADYRGSLRTVVQVNGELPMAGWRMVELVAHEAYPGHHCEAVCKDDELVGRRGRAELGVWLYPTPQALIAEGIAMLAPEALLGEEIEEVGAACLRPLGLDYDLAGSAAARRAAELLLPVRVNLSIRLDEERLDRDGARAYARRWLVEDDRYVERLLDNLIERRWPPYESCYPEGLALCRRYVAGDDERFGRLLREQLTPEALAG